MSGGEWINLYQAGLKYPLFDYLCRFQPSTTVHFIEYAAEYLTNNLLPPDP